MSRRLISLEIGFCIWGVGCEWIESECVADNQRAANEGEVRRFNGVWFTFRFNGGSA